MDWPWLVPATFVGVMALGGALGTAGYALPYPEIGIALSVVVLGVAVALRVRLPALAAMTLAGVRKLPMVFVCDNNQWAYSTPAHLEFATDHVADRAEAYGFEGIVVDGTDVLAVYREAKRAIEKARAGGGPTLIECMTLRMEGHAVHDDAFYVPKELFEKWAENDPIERFRTWLRTNAEMTDEEEDEITGEVKKTLNDALRRAEESPLPDPSTLLEGVYATSEDLDTPHHKQWPSSRTCKRSQTACAPRCDVTNASS